MKALEPIFLPKPTGLYNTGSICYFNSLLQVLASCTALHHWKSRPDSKLGKSFEHFINNNINLDPMESTNLLAALKEAVPHFGNGQESASEALTLIINSINDNALNNMFIHRFKYTIKCLSCFHTTEQIKDHSILFELFHVSEMNSFNMSNQITILSDYKCEQCSNIGAVKISRLTMLPEIIVCLFNVYHNKTVHPFPDTLEFPGINKPLKYIVIGQVEHSGSLNGGHYWARALRRDGTYLFNDNTYSKSIIEPTANTYIVVYHFID